jgi:hypothetical protein
MTGPSFVTQNDPSQTEDQNLDQSDSGESQEQVDQTSQATDSSTPASDPRELQILEQYARNASQQNQVLQQQLHEMRQQLSGLSARTEQAAPKTPIITDDDLRERPAEAMERLFEAKLEERLNRTIAPLLEEQRNQSRERAFVQNFSSTLQSINPQLVPYAEPIATEVRQFLGSADPTPQNLQMATYMILGKYAASGGLPQNNPTAPSNSPSTPPMTRQPIPAAAPTSAPRSRPAAPKLDEVQLRAFNRLGYKAGQEQEFMDFLNADEVQF